MPDDSPINGTTDATARPTGGTTRPTDGIAAHDRLLGGDRQSGGDRLAAGTAGRERSDSGAADPEHSEVPTAGRERSEAGTAGRERSEAEAAGRQPSEAGTSDRQPSKTGTADQTKIGRLETTAAGDKAGFRLAAFGALLIVVLFAGYGLGRLNNSTVSASAPKTPKTTATNGAAMPGMAMDESQPHTHSTEGTVTPTGASPAGAAVGGLSLSSGGLTLVPTTSAFTAGKPQRLSFRIVGPGGAPITTYAVVHDKLLHLIVIRRDLSGFQHLHPSMAADGTWGIDLTLAQPGIYRMIADFTALVGGKPLATTLGSDLTVAGNYAPAALPAPVKAVATDGFAVGYEGLPSTKSTQPILVSVAGPDRQAAVLEPYLGAYGHLVVLREGDLAYVHVHPEAQLVDGKVKFWLAAPSTGTYRMFFDFQVAGTVHTAAWTVDVS